MRAPAATRLPRADPGNPDIGSGSASWGRDSRDRGRPNDWPDQETDAAPSLIKGNNGPPGFFPFFLMGGAAQIVGAVLLAILIMRGRTGQRWVGVVLVLSALGVVVSIPINSGSSVLLSLISLLGELLLMVAFVGIDYQLLVALLDEKDVGRPVARAAVDVSKRDHDVLIPVTAFSESIVAPYRRSRRDGRRAEAALAALGNLVDVTKDIASRAAQLRATRQIKLPDSLILATAMQMAADQILTLDRRWRGVDPRVLLLEP